MSRHQSCQCNMDTEFMGCCRPGTVSNEQLRTCPQVVRSILHAIDTQEESTWNKMAFINDDWTFLDQYELPQEIISAIKEAWRSSHKAWFSLATYLMEADDDISAATTLYGVSIDNIPVILQMFKNRRGNDFRVIIRDKYDVKTLYYKELSSAKEAVANLHEARSYKSFMGSLLPPKKFRIKYDVYQVFNQGREDEDLCCVCQEPSRGFRIDCNHAICLACVSKITYTYDNDDDDDANDDDASDFGEGEPIFKCPSCRKKHKFQ